MNNLPENPRQFAKMSIGNSSRLKSTMARAVLCAESGNQTWPACKNSERILLQNAFWVFLAIKRSAFGQPDSHLGWTTSIPFESIFPDCLGTWAESHNCFKMENGKNYTFLIFLFQIYVNFISSQSKSNTNYWVAWMWLDFNDYHGFKPKIGHPKQYWTLV